MRSKPPFIRQERSDTCMLACLRMVLASCGIKATESALVEQVSLEEGGLDPAALAALAERYGLKAEPRQVDIETIAELVGGESVSHSPGGPFDPGQRIRDSRGHSHSLFPALCPRARSVARRTPTHVAKIRQGGPARCRLGSRLGSAARSHWQMSTSHSGRPRCFTMNPAIRWCSRSITFGSGTMCVRPESGTISKSLPWRNSESASFSEWRK